MSHDCIAGSVIQLTEVMYFLKFSADQFLVFQLITGSGPSFQGGIQFAFCLQQKLNYSRRHFLEHPLRASLLALAKSIYYTFTVVSFCYD